MERPFQGRDEYVRTKGDWVLRTGYFGKERGARQIHERLFDCANVNRTSLDHLLLGKAADGDKMSRDPSITRDRKDARATVSRCW